MEKDSIKVLARNREAYHEYFVEEEMEAGIELKGTEVKSIRAGTLNLKDSYCTVKDGELFVHSMHISSYENGNIFNKDPGVKLFLGRLTYNRSCQHNSGIWNHAC